MILNRLDALYAMAPTALSETFKYALEHVSDHNSTQRAFREVSWSDSESSSRALRNGANGAFGAFGAVSLKTSNQQACSGSFE